MNIGKVIQEIRKQKKVTQHSLSKECGITQTYLSQIETNQKEPSISLLKKIAEHLDIPLPILFFLSIENEDVPKEKRDAYNIIAPSIKSFINEFFKRDYSKEN